MYKHLIFQALQIMTKSVYCIYREQIWNCEAHNLRCFFIYIWHTDHHLIKELSWNMKGVALHHTQVLLMSPLKLVKISQIYDYSGKHQYSFTMIFSNALSGMKKYYIALPTNQSVFSVLHSLWLLTNHLVYFATSHIVFLVLLTNWINNHFLERWLHFGHIC